MGSYSAGGGFANDYSVDLQVASIESLGYGIFDEVIDNGDLTVSGATDCIGNFRHRGTGLGFYGTGPAAKATITGSKASNAALASLLNALNVMGLVTDSTSA